MPHFLDDTLTLKIGHRTSVDGRRYMAITKHLVNNMESVPRIKGRGYDMFLPFFSVSAKQLAVEQGQEITFILEEGVADEISKNTDLIFELEMGPGGNVCFANSPELRDDFKIGFSPLDILNYSYGVLHSPAYMEKHKEPSQTDFLYLPYPTDAVTFWKMVRSGRETRKA